MGATLVSPDELAAEAGRFQLALPAPAVERLLHYLALLARWGQTLSLTADPRPATVLHQHLPDAFALAGLAPAADRGPALDVGSGAGLPGLVLALLQPERPFLLLEPNQRKCSFLRTAAHELGLPAVEVREARLEATTLPPAALALSRAAFAPAAWLARAAPLVFAGGRVAAFLIREDRVRPPPELALAAERVYPVAHGPERRLVLFRRTPVSRETSPGRS